MNIAVRAAMSKHRFHLQGWAAEPRGWQCPCPFELIALLCCAWRAQLYLIRDITKPTSYQPLNHPDLQLNEERWGHSLVTPKFATSRSFGAGTASSVPLLWGLWSGLCHTELTARQGYSQPLTLHKGCMWKVGVENRKRNWKALCSCHVT